MYLRFGALFVVGALCVIPLWASTPASRTSDGRDAVSRAAASSASVTAAANDPSASSAEPGPGEGDPAPVLRRQPPIAWREADEDDLLSSLRELGPDDAELSLQLAREAGARFPGGPRAAESGYFEVRSLVNLGRLEEAVARARVLMAAHPHHPLANEVARHLLTHPLTHPTERR
jgi:hypothetical protein